MILHEPPNKNLIFVTIEKNGDGIYSSKLIFIPLNVNDLNNNLIGRNNVDDNHNSARASFVLTLIKIIERK